MPPTKSEIEAANAFVWDLLVSHVNTCQIADKKLFAFFARLDDVIQLPEANQIHDFLLGLFTEDITGSIYPVRYQNVVMYGGRGMTYAFVPKEAEEISWLMHEHICSRHGYTREPRQPNVGYRLLETYANAANELVHQLRRTDLRGVLTINLGLHGSEMIFSVRHATDIARLLRDWGIGNGEQTGTTSGVIRVRDPSTIPPILLPTVKAFWELARSNPYKASYSDVLDTFCMDFSGLDRE